MICEVTDSFKISSINDPHYKIEGDIIRMNMKMFMSVESYCMLS